MSTATAERLMPTVATPRTKPDGTPYTPEVRETHTEHIGGFPQQVQRVPYFELERNGGIRKFEVRHFPTTVFQAYADASTQGRVELRTAIAQHEAGMADLLAAGWYAEPDEARLAHEGAQQAVARAAAEVAHAAERLSEPAKREYKRRSAESPDHITE